MPKHTTASVNIPFPGWYESILSCGLDHAEETMFDNDSNEMELERQQPEALRLAPDELAECLFDAMDYSAAHEYLTRQYVAAFDYVVGDALGYSVSATRTAWKGDVPVTTPYRRPSIRAVFEEMVSPREYNFTTDRVFVKVPMRLTRKLFAKSKATGHAMLKTLIAERFTSRSGFISFYSNNIDDWLAKPLAEWDSNELGTLLRAALLDAGLTSRKLTDSIMEHLNEDFYAAVNQACDWTKFEQLKAEKRAAKSPAAMADT